MSWNTTLRILLGMPQSELPVRLVTPPAHPHTALTPAELAQVRLDLELAEPKTCNFQLWGGSLPHPEPVSPECGKVAVQQRLLACGAVRYQCAEHATPNPALSYFCPICKDHSVASDHIIAEMPL
jgi:hypothetical protein